MSSLPFRALIFDLDGTLADSLGELAQAMNAALARHGFPAHSLDAYKRMVGEGVVILSQRALPASSAITAAQLADDFRAEYLAAAHEQTFPYPGIPELLDGATRLGLPMAVLSNKREDFTRALVEKRFSRWPFVAVHGERADVPRKPDPAAALEIARALGLPPSEIGFVGDTAIDMRTARAAGMTPVGVLWGFRDRAELEGNGARFIIAHPAELLALR